MKAKYILALVAASWALPVFRAVKFLLWARDYFTEDGTINASNDFNYAKSVAFAYLVGLGVMMMLTWMLARTRTGVLWVLIGVALLLVTHVISIKPEQPIHLFPPFSPLVFAMMMGALGLIGVTSYRDHRIKLEHSTPQ